MTHQQLTELVAGESLVGVPPHHNSGVPPHPGGATQDLQSVAGETLAGVPPHHDSVAGPSCSVRAVHECEQVTSESIQLTQLKPQSN